MNSFPDYFLSRPSFDALLQTILETYTSNIQSVIEGQDILIPLLDVTIDLIEAVISSFLQNDRMADVLLPAVFLHAYLTPMCAQGVESVITKSPVAAMTLWGKWLKATSEMRRRGILRVVVGKLRSFIAETNIYPS